MTFRFLAGLGLGGMLVVDPSMLAEYLPPQRRGRLLVFLDFWWPVGLLLATGLSYVFLGPTFNRFGDWSWRYLFVAAAFPAFLVFFARRTLPESPYFLARKGRNKEAAEVLSEITGEPVAERDFEAPLAPRSSMTEFFTGALRGRAFPTALIWIALNVSYYGLFLWLPFVLQAEKSFHDQRLPAPDAERAVPVPGLRGRDLARREDRAQADARHVPAPRRALRLRVRRVPTRRPST